ncbi:tyrosine-type recombinase/integrase [Canibacter oris]|uniref:Integrase n=1 Tax=Canibacter oris TaxID=1365628 RepID=A0A840DNS1_9MICO|nr:site-specific integrase [Canibacter oris]MBB4071727.1 integrase [Canibacter oris]
MEPDEVTPDIVRAWYLKRQQVAPSSASSEAGHLRAIFASLISERAYDRVNPVPSHLTRIKTKPKELDRLTPGQLNALIAFYDEQAPQYALAVCLGAFAGLRIGEVRALTRADLTSDGERYTVRVNKQAAWNDESGEFYEADPKSADSVRQIPLPAALKERVEQHLRGMDNKLKSAILFTPRARKDGKPNAHKFVGKSPWRNLWLRACLAAEIDYMVDSDGERVPYNPAEFKGGRGHKRPDVVQRHVFKFHGLRGIYATALGEVSNQSYMAGQLLGHSSKGVTERHYLAAVPEQARAALADAAYEVLTGARSNIIEFKARSVA